MGSKCLDWVKGYFVFFFLNPFHFMLPLQKFIWANDLYAIYLPCPRDTGGRLLSTCFVICEHSHAFN